MLLDRLAVTHLRDADHSLETSELFVLGSGGVLEAEKLGRVELNAGFFGHIRLVSTFPRQFKSNLMGGRKGWAPFLMIRFIITEGHRYTLEAARRDRTAPKIEVLSYDQLLRQRRPKRATYIFTDFDRLSAGDLELAARLYQRIREAGQRVLNDPARVKLRFALLRHLQAAGLNDFGACRAEDWPQPVRFPVFVRKMRGHGWPSSTLLHTAGEVEGALRQQVTAGIPLEHLIVIEYVGETIRPGLFRKLAAFRMGSVISPYLCGHDDNWLVKVGKAGIAGAELYEDEFCIVRDNPFAESLRQAFEVAEIEYGRADYGFYQGRLQVFEINTNPHIAAPTSPGFKHPFPRRGDTIALTWKNALAGLHALDTGARGTFTMPPDPLLSRLHGWGGLFRTRPVS